MGALGTYERVVSVSAKAHEQQSHIEHYHMGGTERAHGTYQKLDEAEAAVAQEAIRWLGRYGQEAVHVEQGYVSLWRRGVRIDFRTAFSCTNPRCAPAPARAPITTTVRRAA